MVKKIVLGSVVALGLVGCGGSGNSNGNAFAWGVNALPNAGGLTITTNGSVIMNNAGYGSSSGLFTAVGSGTGVQSFLTNNSSTQLAAGTSNLLAGGYYMMFALGANNPLLVVYPTNVSAPPANEGQLMVVNASVGVAAVDMYATITGNPQTTANLTTLTPLNSGNQISLPVGTYDVQFKVSPSTSSSPALVDVPGVVVTGPGTATAIQLVGIEDTQTGAATPQQALPILTIPVITSSARQQLQKPWVVGHPEMTSIHR